MPSFHYSALTPEGTPISGVMQAESADDLRARLEGEGLRILRIDPVEVPEGSAATPPDVASAASFRPGDDLLLARQLSGVTQARLPLPDAMRALAAESRGSRLRQAFLRLAGDLERGVPLDEALEQHKQGVPPHLAGLIRAGVRANALGVVLDRYVRSARTVALQHRRVLLSIAYPLCLCLLLVVMLLAIVVFVVPQLVDIYEGFADFGLDVNVLFRVLIAASSFLRQHGAALLVVLLLAVAAAWGGMRLLGPLTRRRIVASLPWLGTVYEWTSLAMYSRLLAVLLRYGVPLPEALALAGAGAGDPELEVVAAQLSAEVSQGQDLALLAQSSPWVPTRFRRLFRWASQGKRAADSLDAAADMFESQASQQALLVPELLEPAVIVFMGIVIGLVMIILFLPVVGALSSLH